MQCTLAPRTDILDSAAGPQTDIIATMAVRMIDNVAKIAVRTIGIVVDAVDPVIDILVSATNLRTDFVGRGAGLVTVLIVSMITPTTDIATSRDPRVICYPHLNQHGRVDLDRTILHFQVVAWFQLDSLMHR